MKLLFIILLLTESFIQYIVDLYVKRVLIQQVVLPSHPSQDYAQLDERGFHLIEFVRKPETLLAMSKNFKIDISANIGPLFRALPVRTSKR